MYRTTNARRVLFPGVVALLLLAGAAFSAPSVALGAPAPGHSGTAAFAEHGLRNSYAGRPIDNATFAEHGLRNRYGGRPIDNATFAGHGLRNRYEGRPYGMETQASTSQ